MKKTVLILLTAMAGSVAMGQGQVNFANLIGPVASPTLNAPVTFVGDQRPGAPLGGQALATGPNFVAQLLAAPIAGGAYVAQGTPVPFRTAGPGAGWFPGSLVTVDPTPGTPSTGARVVVAAWAVSLGATYADAVAAGIGGYGTSAEIQVTFVAPPGTPPDLTGLQAFNIQAVVPEPSVLALGALGAGWLMLRRKKS